MAGKYRLPTVVLLNRAASDRTPRRARVVLFRLDEFANFTSHGEIAMTLVVSVHEALIPFFLLA